MVNFARHVGSRRTVDRDNYGFRRQGTQLSLTNRATHICKRNGVAIIAAAHMCYSAQFGSSALNGVDINTGETRKLRCVGMGDVTDPTRILPTCVTASQLVVLRQRLYA